jgi:hypothetical protein
MAKNDDTSNPSTESTRRAFLTTSIAAAGGVAAGTVGASPAQAGDCPTSSAKGPMPAQDREFAGIERLITRILGEPRLVETLFENPRRVAETVAIELTDREVK